MTSRRHRERTSRNCGRLLLFAALLALSSPGCELRDREPFPPHARESTTKLERTSTAHTLRVPRTKLPNVPIAVFFSTPQDSDDAEPPLLIDEAAAAFIDAASTTLDCAFFELQSGTVASALVEAHRRGVRVRLVLDTDYRDNSEVGQVERAGIPIVWDKRSALMHNKFMVADGSAVWTGSWNATDNCSHLNNNNAVVIRSTDVARNFATEFEEMFVSRSFGPRSPSNTPYSKTTAGGADVYTWFAPEDAVPDKVMRFVRAARRSVHVLAFSFSDDELGDLLAAKKRAGIEVGVVLEGRGSGSGGSEFARLDSAGVAVLPDANRHAMHHKVIIVDGVWTVTGSFNFSRSAAESNDENLIVIKSPQVAAQFEAEYQRLMTAATARARGDAGTDR